MILGKESDKVVNKFREVAAGVYPRLEIRRSGGTARVNERMAGMNWVSGIWGDEDHWRHERVVFMEPNYQGNRWSAIGDMKLPACIEKVHGCAIVVSEGAERRRKSRVFLQQRKKMLPD